jgi:O-antigen/teichoic acid export membrane protein
LQPSYYQSIEIVRILSLAIPFIFALAAQGSVLLSSEKYLRLLLGVSLFNLAINIIFNWLLIPLIGIYAAAWMTVASQIMAFVIYFSIIYYAFGKNED